MTGAVDLQHAPLDGAVAVLRNEVTEGETTGVDVVNVGIGEGGGLISTSGGVKVAIKGSDSMTCPIMVSEGERRLVSSGWESSTWL